MRMSRRSLDLSRSKLMLSNWLISLSLLLLCCCWPTSTLIDAVAVSERSWREDAEPSDGDGAASAQQIQHVKSISADDVDDVYIASLVNNRHQSFNNGYNKALPDFGNSLDEFEAKRGGGEGDDGEQEEETTYPPPVFDFGMPRNITARTGHTAAINCRVDNLGDKSVSWIRKRDLHILTAGILTYTSDERFKVVRTADSKDWTLHVKYAQPRDSGIYECQVNTEPKISMAFRLNVIVTPPDAKAIIAGPADLYVKVGSVITLTCHVKQPATAAQDIGPIYWYRGPYILTPFVAHPNDAAIDLQRISMESTLAEKLQSRLRIANAQLLDTGNYTCMPTTAEAASVVVNVINDESPAAMQKSSASPLGQPAALELLLMLAFAAAVSWSSCLDNNTVVRWWLHKWRRSSCTSSEVVASSALLHLHINYCWRRLTQANRIRRLKLPSLVSLTS